MTQAWDLTRDISPYLDPHMILPLLQYLEDLLDEGVSSYKKADVTRARLALVQPTKMVNYAAEIAQSLNESVGDVQKEKDAVFQELESLKSKCKTLDKLCTTERSTLEASNQWNVVALKAKGVDASMLAAYLTLARTNFDCGDYKVARDRLANYISIFADADMADTDKMYNLATIDNGLLQVLWGRLACDILLEDWETASTSMDAVRTGLETLVMNQEMDALTALEQRTWLLHWSLFVYWNDTRKTGPEQLVELFHSERFKQAIVTNAPHLVRYWTAAVLLCKRRVSSSKASSTNEARRLLKNLVYALQDCEYTDPIVEFVNSLTIKFDFEAAQQKLSECEAVLKSDFFLCRQSDFFMEEARIFVFENYCRIHNKIDLQDISDKLAMNRSDAEKWIVDLICRAEDLDAVIDQDCVVMGTSVSRGAVSVCQQVSRIRDFNSRASTIQQTYQTHLNEARKEKAKKERDAKEE